MTRARTGNVAAAVLVASLAAGGAAAQGLTQRVWLLRGVPGETTLTALRAAGIDGYVLPVGDVVVENASCRLTLASLPDLKPLAGWTVTPLVWVSGSGESRGDAETFVNEFAPVQRLLPGKPSLVLASRAAWPGLSEFAGAVAKRIGSPAELLLPAPALTRLPLSRLPAGLKVIAVAFGDPPALGFPASTIADDLSALAAIDDAGPRYRVALVVAPRAVPIPGAGGGSLASLARSAVAEYQPAERGDAFILRQRLDWGGRVLSPGDKVEVEVIDTARYHRDLGLVLRGVRPTLEGWDTVGLPDREPALGMSAEAFLDYLQGGRPYPEPLVEAEWTAPTRLLLGVANPTPHASALASTGNFVELTFAGTQLADVTLGDFSGVDYARVEGSTWKRTAARDANSVRLYFTYLAPASRLGGARLSFFGRPAATSGRWLVRLGDGREAGGAVRSLASAHPPG